MLINVLVIAFVSVYCAIVLLGHVLLALAIWPGLFPKRRMPLPKEHSRSELMSTFAIGAIPVGAAQVDVSEGNGPQAGLPPRRFAA